MNKRSLFALLFATALFSMTACNNSEQGKDTATNDSLPPQTPATPTAASTVITTPQYMLVVRHKVTDFAKWKMAYDNHDSARLAAGVHSYVISRGVEDSNMLMVAMRADDSARAMAFVKDPSLKSVMQKAGLVGTPNIGLNTIVFQDTATVATTLRSIVTFTVKDWNTWLQHFQTGTQERADNGIMVRSYGHDAADDHKVRVVTALLDSAKAVAYFKSDGLKKRMQESGVTGKADRFLYRVVQRY